MSNKYTCTHKKTTVSQQNPSTVSIVLHWHVQHYFCSHSSAQPGGGSSDMGHQGASERTTEVFAAEDQWERRTDTLSLAQHSVHQEIHTITAGRWGRAGERERERVYCQHVDVVILWDMVTCTYVPVRTYTRTYMYMYVSVCDKIPKIMPCWAA